MNQWESELSLKRALLFYHCKDSVHVLWSTFHVEPIAGGKLRLFLPEVYAAPSCLFFVFSYLKASLTTSSSFACKQTVWWAYHIYKCNLFPLKACCYFTRIMCGAFYLILLMSCSCFCILSVLVWWVCIASSITSVYSESLEVQF